MVGGDASARSLILGLRCVTLAAPATRLCVLLRADAHRSVLVKFSTELCQKIRALQARKEDRRMHAGGAVVAGNDNAVGRAAAAVLFGHRHRSAELAPSSSTSAVAFVWQPRSHKLKPLTRARAALAPNAQ